MKMLSFRRATIQPLIKYSIWIAEMQSDDGVDNFYKYYRMDDFGDPYEIHSVLALNDFPGIRPISGH